MQKKKTISHLKNNRNSFYDKRYKKGIEKGGEMKIEKYKKSLTI